jgi:outer membrane receptor for Fe3+-dicitrate
LYLETFVKKAQNKINPKTIAVAASLAALQIGSAYAQTLNLDEVVVTASPTGRTKMKSSDSVTSVGEEAIMRSGATSAAEILRSVPGIRAESSGGEGNANITVRGAPVSAGGSRYVQMQEDGLPILLFGDIAFGTPDQFMRTDFTQTASKLFVAVAHRRLLATHLAPSSTL